MNDDVIITINTDGTGSVTTDGVEHPLQAADSTTVRQLATQQAAAHAATLGRDATATAYENGRTFPLTISADGTIKARTNKTPAPQAPPDESEPVITEVPGAQVPEEPADEDTRPRPVTPLRPEQKDPTDEGAPTEGTPAQDPVAPAQPPALAGPSPEREEPAEHAQTSDHAHDAEAEHKGEDGRPPRAQGGEPTGPTSGGEARTSAPTDPVETDSRWAGVAAQPATQGIRGALNRFGMKFAPETDELAQRREELRATIAREETARREDEQREAHEREQETRRQARERARAERDREQRALIQTNFDDGRTITMVNVKGGAGKTTAAFLIAATLGRVRGGGVVAWDANETRGTLGFRAAKDAHERTVVDLLGNASAFGTVEGSRLPTLMRYVRQQGDDQFVVLASDKDPEAQEMVDADGFRTVHEILERFMNVIVVDTGNNERAAHFLAAIEATDQLVIPISPGADSVAAAEWTMDALAARGHEDLVRHAIVLLQDSATRPGDGAEIAARFEGKVRQILPIPYDPALDGGTEIIFDELQPSTRAAFQEATASIAQGLAQRTDS